MTYRPFDWVVEFAPGFYPFNEPAEGDWVNLGDVLEASWSRGRQDDTSEYEAGVLDVLLDNADEDLDQLLPGSLIYDDDALPDTPVRLVAVRGPLRKVMITGYTLDGFSPSGIRGGGRLAVTVVDWMGWAEQIETPDCPWAAWVAFNRPLVWMRSILDRESFGSGAGTAWNMAMTTAMDWVHDPSHPDYVTKSGTSIVSGKSGGPVILGFTGAAGGMAIPIGGSLAQNEAFSCAFWFKAATGFAFLVGAGTWNITMNGSGHIVANVIVGGITHTSTIAVAHNNDAPHLVTLEVRSGGSGTRRMRLTSDLGTDTDSIGASNVSGGGNIQIYGTDSARLDEFAYFDGVDTLDLFFTPNPHSSWVAGSGPYLWLGDDVYDRLDRHIKAAGIDVTPVLDVDVDSAYSPTGYGFDDVSTLADALRQMGAIGLGGAFTKRDGSLRVRDWLFTATDDAVTAYTAKISDDPAAPTWTRSSTDNFNRANNTTLGSTWTIDAASVFVGGLIGIISNTAYVNGAASLANVPAHSYRKSGRDVSVQVAITGVVAGQGLVVRRADGTSGGSNLIAVVQGTGTVEVIQYVDGTPTVIGNTGADTLNGTLKVSTSAETLTVQIDSGTVHSFTVTDGALMVGDGVGLIYTGTSTPANTARWDTYTVSASRSAIRAVNRSRSGTRKDRIVNSLLVTTTDGENYAQDKGSLIRYGFRRRTIDARNEAPSGTYVAPTLAIVADKKDPPVEVGDLTLALWGDQEATDWAVLDCELDRPVKYREALYRAGTEVIDGDFRVARESWQISNRTDVTLTLKIVPA